MNPIVVVDESHNAESDLSVEMLNNLNPSFVLDLTATPKDNSNIISFVNAIALKKENMVKLPVIVYNHHKKEEVITSALHLQRQLETIAIAEENETGKYIRPIILFQAQSNIKGKNNTTFQKIKEQLIKLKIPEEQIKIKVSGNDELKGLDLSSKDCKVKYIITVNALKEGWDCPFAYILASLADKSSAVDVEQILGRVLRQPYVSKHSNQLLNLSYVLTASSKFNETLENIVKGLQESGFSKDDYYAEEVESNQEISGNIEAGVQTDIFNTSDENTTTSDDDFDVEQIDFDPSKEADIDSIYVENQIIESITTKAKSEGKAFEDKINNSEDDDNDYLLREMGKNIKKYKIAQEFIEIASSIEIPQFFIKETVSENTGLSLFEELGSEYKQLLSRNKLLNTFKLSTKDTEIDFEDSSAEVYKVDFDETRKSTLFQKLNSRQKSVLIDNILSKPQESKINTISSIIVSKLGDMYPISEQELKKYVSRVFEELTNEQVRDIISNEFVYIQKIKKKIKSLMRQHAKDEFIKLLDVNEIYVEANFEFKKAFTPIKTAPPIAKSLYEREASMNTFEQNVISDIASLDNIVFWHRNLERGHGFALNAFDDDHYPDFIIYTNKGNLLLIETKGDFLANAESEAKNILGKHWAEKAGNNYKYFMVFESKVIDSTYNAKTIIDVIKRL